MKASILFLSVFLPLSSFGGETGYASWYGSENKVSSKGKPIQHYSYPALAHKTLPIGTKVLIVNQKNNRSVVAVVEDRGPYKKGRIADLNYIAAKNIGMLVDGVVKIKLEKL
jgi:rare lipoprotein A